MVHEIVYLACVFISVQIEHFTSYIYAALFLVQNIFVGCMKKSGVPRKISWILA